MQLRQLALAAGAGALAFLAVGLGVTELLAPRVAFSVFLGAPAGLLAGVAVALAVLLADGGHARAVRGLAAFGLTFALALVGAVAVLALPVVVSLLGAAVVALVAGVAVALLAPAGDPA